MGLWQRTRKLRWWIIIIVMLGTIINYLVRSTLGVAMAAPEFRAEMQITPEQYGWVTGIFQAGIMLQPVVGYILDRIGIRTGFAVFASAWGILTFAHGMVSGWQWLAVLRGLLGFAEGTAHTGGLKVVSEWFPARERGFAGGIYNLGASAGVALAAPLVAYSILLWNWRAAFFIAGILAILWVLLWLRYYYRPEDHAEISAEERAFIAAGQEEHVQATGDKPRILSLLGQRNFWGIALPRFLADPTWATLTLWMPLYLADERGFDLGQIALFAFLPFVAADLGCLFGPAVVLWLERKGIGLIDARRWTFTLGALLMTGMMFVGSVSSPYVAVLLLSLGGFAHQTLSVTCITMASDLYPRNELGTVAGMAGTMANLGVLIFTLLVGTLVLQIGWTPFFIALSVLDLIAAVLLWTLVQEPGGRKGLESGLIPILLGAGMAGTLWFGVGFGAVGIAGYVAFGFGILLFMLGLAIEWRARTGRAAA
ncbi:MAG TPA: MFS transporter [Allosphingosinicella sp.]|nr:MFS transporter [Allosphingosinicella sp.]